MVNVFKELVDLDTKLIAFCLGILFGIGIVGSPAFVLGSLLTFVPVFLFYEKKQLPILPELEEILIVPEKFRDMQYYFPNLSGYLNDDWKFWRDKSNLPDLRNCSNAYELLVEFAKRDITTQSFLDIADSLHRYDVINFIKKKV